MVHQFRKLGFSQSLPFTEKLFERMLMLPLNMSVTDEEIDYICEKIKVTIDKLIMNTIELAKLVRINALKMTSLEVVLTLEQR